MRPFTGVVLTGGASRRMGRDKASIEIDGRPMVAGVAEALTGAGAAELFVCGPATATLDSLGLRVVPDRWPGEGPLGAIITSLGAASHERVLVVATDLVTPSDSALAAIAAVRADADADLVLPVVAGRRQYLTALWHKRSLSVLEAAFADGARSIRELIGSLTVIEVEGGDPAAFRDADRPQDLTSHQDTYNLIHGGKHVTVPEIDIESFATTYQVGDALIDVREPDEFAEGRVEGATSIPLGQVPDRVAEVPADTKVYIICAAGGRSMKAAEFLTARGIDAINIAGGTKAWVASGRPCQTDQ